MQYSSAAQSDDTEQATTGGCDQVLGTRGQLAVSPGSTQRSVVRQHSCPAEHVTPRQTTVFGRSTQTVP